MTGLGPLLHRLRIAAGLTQEDLAQRSGVSVRTISDLERGLRESAYPDTARRLADALGVDGPERDLLLAASRRGGPVPATLPEPATPLIGREAVVEAVLARLRGGTRCLTVLGPGGIGKTRLALEVARRAGAAAYADLSRTADPQLVPHLLARAVGVNPNQEPVIDLVATRIGDRPVLLVLDTFEHVLPAAPEVALLLERCPAAIVLATSRAPLRIRAEEAWPLAPLEPAAAAKLFADRARAVQRDITLDDGVVADICARLDGLPLAIELAAARVRHLPQAAVRDRLGLGLLEGGPRDVPDRHRSMRATVGWSYDLLDEPGRTLLRRLSCFVTFTLEAAEAVDPSGGDVLGRLSGLIDQSLVEPCASPSEVPRWEMLDAIREYAAERCAASGEEAEARDAQATYLVDLAERAAPELGRGDQTRWYRRLDEELANLRLVERRLLARGDADVALQLAGALFRFWLWHGGFAEGRRWLDRALAVEGSTRVDRRGRALWAAGALGFFAGDYEASGRRAEELVALAERSGTPLEMRNGLTIRGMTALATGRLDDAATAFGAALEACPADAAWEQATSVFNVAIAALHRGDLGRADGLLVRAAGLYAGVGDDAYRARVVRNRALCALAAGDPVGAGTLLLESLAIVNDLGDAWGLAETLEAAATPGAPCADAEGCALALAAAERLRAEIGATAYPFDTAFAERFVAPVRSTGGWTDGWSAGAAADLTDVAAQIASRVQR